MGYISNQDIIDRVGSDAAVQLTYDSGSTANQTVLDEVRLSAEGEVNGYLARRYAVPVNLTAHPEWAATLKSFVLDVAAYRLFSRRPPPSERPSERHRRPSATPPESAKERGTPCPFLVRCPFLPNPKPRSQ